MMGGYGYSSEYDMERLLRATLVSTIYGGTSEIQRNIIAKTLGGCSVPVDRRLAAKVRHIRRRLLSLLVAVVIAGCGGEAAPTSYWSSEEQAESPPPSEHSAELSARPDKSNESPSPAGRSAGRSERSANEPTAAEVAEFLGREVDYSRRRTGNNRPKQIRVRVYASEHQLRQEQRFLEKALRGFQPTAVTCGVIRVEVTAEGAQDARMVERNHAQDLKRALSAEYHC